MPPVTRPAAHLTSTDPVLETQVFWTKYRTPILLGLVAVVFAALAYAGSQLYLMRRDAAAASLLAEAKTPEAYQQVIAQYSSAPAGASASILLATEQRKAQKFEEANATLQKFISGHSKHELVTTAKMAMAANTESLGKSDDALEMYRRLAADYPRSFTAPLAMLAQVHLLKGKGQIDQARQVCETVMTQFRDSEAAAEASRYLRTLKPVAGDTTPTAQLAPAGAPSPSAAQASPVASVASTP